MPCTTSVKIRKSNRNILPESIDRNIDQIIVSFYLIISSKAYTECTCITRNICLISITPTPSPTPEPEQVESAAVTTNGDVTMVNIYAAENPGVTTSTDSTADSGNTDNSENTDDSSSTDDSENISESDSSDQDDNSEDSYDSEDQGDNSEE